MKSSFQPTSIVCRNGSRVVVFGFFRYAQLRLLGSFGISSARNKASTPTAARSGAHPEFKMGGFARANSEDEGCRRLLVVEVCLRFWLSSGMVLPSILRAGTLATRTIQVSPAMHFIHGCLHTTPNSHGSLQVGLASEFVPTATAPLLLGARQGENRCRIQGP